MKRQITTLTLGLLLSLTSQAARVGVTDSGTDFSHEWLKGRALINEKEVAGNRVDDDRNGKVDDVSGWNFIDDFGKIFFPEHLQSIDEKTFKYFEVIARIQAETTTPEDKIFWEENVTRLDDKKKAVLMNNLNFYGQYAHSTHCSGIVAQLSPDSKILSSRVFPDAPPAENEESAGSDGMAAKTDPKSEKGGKVTDFFYKLLAALTNGSFDKVSVYLKERQIDVANYSLGVPLSQIARLALAAKGTKEPTEDQVAAETRRVAAQFEPAGRKWMMMSPGTLFVVAAGNDGSDNDKVPVFPANVQIENSIVVGASNGFGSLANFSNYGAKSVDVAAPGVAIMSSVPSLSGKQLLPMSGTSMAAPYVAGVAARVKDLNPKLKPSEIKQILFGTVDEKSWLSDKVKSKGVVNAERAYMAAEKSKSMPVVEALKEARLTVQDQPETKVHANRLGIQATAEMKNFANQVVF